jgi:hypothetical protein
MIDTFNPQRDELTILDKPDETRFSIDVYLQDCKHLIEKNGYAENYFTFFAKTAHDQYMLEEAIDRAVSKLEREKPDWSRKKPQAKCKSPKKRHEYFASQLFKPKGSATQVERVEELNYREASVTFHFRDDPEGYVYLQAEWVDLYAEDNGVSEYEPSGRIDYDF